MEWFELFTVRHAPNIKDIEDYLSENFVLYENYIKYLKNSLGLTWVKSKYSKKFGWYQSIGVSGIVMVKQIMFHDHIFNVEGIKVSTQEDLQFQIIKAKELYETVFNKKVNKIRDERRLKNVVKRENKNSRIKNIIKTYNIDISKFNKFSWAEPVSQRDIINLYKSDSLGILDEGLVDEVGYGFYARCIQAKEERDLIKMNKIKCHHCKQILSSENEVFICKCGYIYTFNEYCKSFKENKMPCGNAISIFDDFIIKWGCAKNEIRKMQVIDWLIHEIHIGINGMTGRFVAQQLIEGTGEEIKNMILNLAYGDISVASESNLNRFKYYKNEISENTYKSYN